MLLPNDPNSVEAQSSQAKCNGNFISRQNRFPALLCRGFVAFALMGLFFALQNQAVKSKPLYLWIFYGCLLGEARTMIADAPPNCLQPPSLPGLFWGSEPKFSLVSKEWRTQSTTLGRTSASSAEAIGSSSNGVISQTLAWFWFDLAQRELTKWIQSTRQFDDQTNETLRETPLKVTVK